MNIVEKQSIACLPSPSYWPTFFSCSHEATCMSTIGEQQAIISDLAATVDPDSMLTCLNAYHSVGQKANTMILVKTVGTCPEFIFAHASCQVILQSWPVVNRKGIVSNDGDICRRVFIAQYFGSSNASNSISNNQIGDISRHHKTSTNITLV